MTKKYESPLTINEGPVPKAAIKPPEIAGPTRRPALKLAEFNETALGRSVCPTTSVVKAWRTGASIAVEIPKIPASTKTCHSAIRSVITSAPKASDAAPPTTLVRINTFRLLNRSASFPPCSEKARTGAN